MWYNIYVGIGIRDPKVTRLSDFPTLPLRPHLKGKVLFLCLNSKICQINVLESLLSSTVTGATNVVVQHGYANVIAETKLLFRLLIYCLVTQSLAVVSNLQAETKLMVCDILVCTTHGAT